MVVAVSCVMLGSMSFAGEPPKEPAPKGPESKPEMRSIQVKSGYLSFNILLRPGVPDPGQVVEITMDMAEVPPVPDPIYGERIPVKNASITASVTDAAGYSLNYRVHSLQDAGSYGFHFTPMRKDTYQVTLKGVYKEKKFNPDFEVPAGIWPFKGAEAKAPTSAPPTSSRLPAVPSGMSAPVAPSGAGATRKVSGRVSSPLQVSMSKVGEFWAKAGVAMLVGRKPDLNEATALAAKLKGAVREAAVMKPSDKEFNSLMKKLWEAVGEFEKAASSGKAAKALETFKRIGSHHCNRCHFKMRWGILKHVGTFPAGLP
jgi:hypothetical protein